MSDQTFLTPEGLKKLEEELVFLRTVRRAQVAEVRVRERGRVQEAADHGRDAGEHGRPGAPGELQRALRVEARVVGHDQRRAGTQLEAIDQVAVLRVRPRPVKRLSELRNQKEPATFLRFT